MTQTKALLQNDPKGTFLNNWRIHTAICSPSRSETISGRYVRKCMPSTVNDMLGGRERDEEGRRGEGVGRGVNASHAHHTANTRSEHCGSSPLVPSHDGNCLPPMLKCFQTQHADDVTRYFHNIKSSLNVPPAKLQPANSGAIDPLKYKNDSVGVHMRASAGYNMGMFGKCCI